jgi:hypothetical protein
LRHFDFVPYDGQCITPLSLRCLWRARSNLKPWDQFAHGAGEHGAGERVSLGGDAGLTLGDLRALGVRLQNDLTEAILQGVER